MINRIPQIVAPLICLLLAGGCGRNAAPQKSEPVVIEKHTRDTIYLTNQDFAIGDDCSQAITALHKSNSLLDKCEKDVNLLLADNETLRTELDKKCPKAKTVIRNSYNTKDSNNDTEINNLKKSNQVLAQENANIKLENSNLSKEVENLNKKSGNADSGVKKSGNTKQTEKGSKFWLGVLVATAVFQGVKHGKKFLPPPFNVILGFIA